MVVVGVFPSSLCSRKQDCRDPPGSLGFPVANFEAWNCQELYSTWPCARRSQIGVEEDHLGGSQKVLDLLRNTNGVFHKQGSLPKNDGF